jgi:DNA polymerase III subunit beta
MSNMQIKAGEFRAILNQLKLCILGRALYPITENALFSDGWAISTDLEKFLSVEVSQADGVESFLVPVKQSLDLLKGVPKDSILDVGVEDGRFVLKGDGVNFSSKMDRSVEDFPPTWDVKGEPFEIQGLQFIKALSEVAVCASKKEIRPVLTGVGVFAEDDGYDVAATDGFRLGWAPVDFQLNELKPIVIPKASVNVLIKLWGNRSQESLQVTHDLNYATFSFGSVELTTQLLQGQFPNYSQLIPKDCKHTLSFDDAGEVYRVLGRLKTIVKEGSGAIRFCPLDQGVELSASLEGGVMVVEVKGVSSSGEAKIAFNVNHLLDYFKGKSGFVSVNFESVSTPGLFSYDGKHNQVIMPMSVQW